MIYYLKKRQSSTTIIPNGVNIEFFKPIENISEVRASLGWKVDTFIIFFNSGTGSNKPVKNIELAHKVLRKLKEFGVTAIIEKAGSFPELELYKRLAASDCLLVSSFHEGSPNIVKEALSCNLPVVSVNCGDVKIRLENVNAGGVFSYNATILANAIKKISEFKSSFNGREELIKQGLDDSSMIQRTIEVYNKAI